MQVITDDYTQKCISETKNMIDRFLDGESFSLSNGFGEYSSIYPRTNENIAAYLSHFDISEYQNGLVVTSSGDHAFNLIHAGIMDIDTFDCNRLTEFYALGLKRAMIQKYSYEKYLRVNNIFFDGNYGLIKEMAVISDLLPYMDKKYRQYWRALLNYAFKNANRMQGTLFGHLFYRSKRSDLMGNAFLISKEDYEHLRGRIAGANISFSCYDAQNIAQNVSRKYDVIMLSNILNYFQMTNGFDWNYETLKEYEEQILSILNPDGVAFLNYIYYYLLEDDATDYVIDGSSILAKEYTGDHELIIPFDNLEKWGIYQQSAVLALKRNIRKKGGQNGNIY